MLFIECSLVLEWSAGKCLGASFTNPITENINSEASYDIFSLIGEIGGTLGLFLGISGLGLLDLFKPTKKWLKVIIKILSVEL